MPTNHSERQHALLSCSGASRWLNCTPSARLEERFGEAKTSQFAEEGTLAHELAELFLKKDVLHSITEGDFDNRLEELMSNEHFSEDMLDYVSIYTQYCSDQYIESKEHTPCTLIDIEQSFDLREYVPDGFGTGDCVIISDGLAEIIDLKYGKGIPVYAEWNKQLMLYALGMLLKYNFAYDIAEVRMTIVQPRLNNISSWHMSATELYDWADGELKAKASLAFAGTGELVAGDWCRFCSIRNRCRKLYEQQLEIAKHEFAGPELLTDEDIADIVKRLPNFVEWANSIAEYAKEKAVAENKQWPGLKLVEGTSRRKWADEEAAGYEILSRFPELSEDQVYKTELLGLTAIEKLVGKKQFSERLSDLVIKPQGKPVLVSVDDKRPAMGIAQAQMDFKE